MISVTLHFTPALVRRASLAYVRRTVGLGGWVALAVSVVAAAYVLASDPGSWLGAAMAGAAGMLLVFILALSDAVYRRGMGKLGRLGEPIAVLELTDASLAVSSQAGSSSIPWSTFTDLWQFPEFWLLFIGRGNFITLPQADMSEEARAFLLARLRASGRVAA